MKTTGARVWVVGASSGLGASLARRLDADGAHVVVSARRRERLDEVVAGTGMQLATVDVTDEASVLAARDRVLTILGGIDILVLSAGVWTVSDVTRWDQASFEQHVATNLVGMGACLGAVLPTMLTQRAGLVVGLASVAAVRGIPGADYYGPTKAAAVNLLEAVRASTRTSGVRVLTVMPGFVDSEMTSTADFPQPFRISTDDAVARIVHGIEQDRTTLVFPRRMRLLMGAARLVPAVVWPRLTPVLEHDWVRRL